MKLPPALARFDYGPHRFWLPIFLLWPLMLLLFALIFFAGAISLARTQKFSVQDLDLFLSGLFAMICGSGGTQIDVDASDRCISLTLR